MWVAPAGGLIEMARYQSWAEGPVSASRWGHSGPVIFVGVIIASVLLQVAHPYPEALQPVVSISFILLLLNTLIEMRRHDRGMCELCVASMPLNPAASAESHRLRLAVVHRLAERAYARAYLIGLVALCLVPFFVPDALHLAARVMWLAAVGSVAYLMLSQVTHRKLQPWCPHCDHNGGTDKVETPEPMPMGGLSR